MGSSRPDHVDGQWSSTTFFEWWNFEENARLHRFVLAPFSASLKLEINFANSSSTNADPRYTAMFYLSRLNCAIDEKQLSIWGLIMDSFNTHDEWRHDMKMQLIAEERRALYTNRDATQHIENEYLVSWDKILSAKIAQLEHFHHIEKSNAWRELLQLERDLPLSYIVYLRNYGSYEDVMKKACFSEKKSRPDNGPRDVTYRDTPEDTPIEVHMQFPRGSTGLVLTYHRLTQELIVIASKEDTAASENRIRPRSRLIKLNGESILEKAPSQSGIDYQKWLDELDLDIKILSFHLPPEEHAEDVPLNVVSRVKFHTTKLKFTIVSAARTIPIIRCVLYDAALSMIGLGDSLFSYHQYDIAIGSFLLQNMIVRHGFWHQEEPLVSYCILSSVRRTQRDLGNYLQDAEKEANRSCSLHLGADFLYKQHQDVKKGSYGVKYLIHLGDIVAVFDEDKITQLVSALYSFQYGILAPEKTRSTHTTGDKKDDTEHCDHRCSHGKDGGSTCLSSVSTMDSSNRTYDEAGFSNLKVEQPKPETRKLIRTTFDVQLGHIRMYICGKDIESSEDDLDARTNHDACSSSHSFDCTEHETQAALVSREASYWNVLHQLAPNDDHESKADGGTRSSDLNMFPRDWIQYNEAVVNVQRHIRGFLARKLPIPRMVLKAHSSVRRIDYAKFGWLYKRDDTLTFCRWQRYWCYMNSEGDFFVYNNGSGAGLVTRFSVATCGTTLMRNGRGPWGLPCHLKNSGTPILEISDANRQILGVFSDKKISVLEEWKKAIEKMSEHLKDRLAYGSLLASVDFDQVQDRRPAVKEDIGPSYQSPFSSIADMMRGYDYFLESGFSDTYTRSKELQKMHTNWLVLDVINVTFTCDICNENIGNHTAFQSNLTAQSMTLLDYRRFDIGRPAVFHIGDEFLSFQKNTFLPSRVILNPFFATKNTYVSVNATYGSVFRDTDDFFVGQKRASLKISLAGWVMPLTILSSIMDISAALSVLWRENPSDSYTTGTIKYQTQDNERHPNGTESRDTLDRAQSLVPARITAQTTSTAPGMDSLAGNALFQVTELCLQLQAPMIEAYIEDIDCVVKLTLEKVVCSLRAGSYAEELTINLGPTALYLLTNEMALRLVQLNKLYVEYELAVWKQAQENWSNGSFAKSSIRKEKRWKSREEKSKRPLCYRFVDIRIGQIKLEADRRLQLLFALIEALTLPSTNDDMEQSLPWKYEEESHPEHLSLDERHRQSIQSTKSRSGGRSKQVLEPPSTLFSSILDDENDPFRTGSGLIDSHLLDQLTYPISGFSRSEHTLRPGFPLSFTKNKDSGSSPNLRRSFDFSPHFRKRFSFSSNHNAPISGAHSQAPYERVTNRCDDMLLGPLMSYQTYIVIIKDKTRCYGGEKCHSMPIRGAPSSSSRKWAHGSPDPGMKSTGKSFLYALKLRKGRVYDCIFFHCDAIVLEVIKRSLSIVALDTYIPVMNFALRDINAEILTNSELSSDYGVSASIGICAQYYNNALADWEPFIEPWRVNALLRKQDDSPNRTTGFEVRPQESPHGIKGRLQPPQCVETTICLSAMERLNINFTHALVCLLCSVAKNRQKQVFSIEKRKPAAVAADSEARKQDGRVCVLNNLGVPIRLANLNTSRRGSLFIEIRDGWAFPSYSRFHNIRMEVVLLPWWSPRQGETLEQLRHVFILPYCGAQSGVTPILRVAVSTAVDEKIMTNAKSFEHDTDPLPDPFSIVNEKDGIELRAWGSATALKPSDDSMEHWEAERDLDPLGPKNVEKKYWQLLGVAEVNLAATVMGYGTSAEQMRLTRWFRLHDARGAPTGEVLLHLKFIPSDLPESEKSDFEDPKVVKDGQFLVFDPLKMVSVGHRTRESCTASSISKTLETELENGHENQTEDERNASQLQHVILADSLRGAYIPPLALEILLDNKRYNLLCPLRRAGKFLIQCDNLTAEVKVAQRDETRRVLLLNSPVQLKNETQANAVFWTKQLDQKALEAKVLIGALFPFGMTHGRMLLQDLLPENDQHAIYLKANSKISVPLSALHGEKKHSIIMSVNNCTPRVIADLDDLNPGTLLLYWSAENDEEHPNSEGLRTETPYRRRNSSLSHSKAFSENSGIAQLWGYCFLVTIASHTRKVYREDQQTLPANEGGNMIYRPKQEKLGHPAKFYKGDGDTSHHRGASYAKWSEVDTQSYATKHQISLHACLLFENTLPVRVQYKVVLEKTVQREEIVIRAGTLSPGKSVRIYEFQKDAVLQLRLPEMDTMWTKPILLAECIYRESSMREQERNLLGLPKVAVKPRAVRPVAVASSAAAAVLTSVQRKISQHDRVVEFYPKAPSLNMMFEKEEMEAKKVITRMDFTQSDNQSPRIVLYASIWIYNQSHMSTLMFRDANDSTASSTVVYAPQIVPEHPNPKLMDCPSHSFEMNTRVDHEIARWSDKLHSAVVGVQDPITFEFGRIDLRRNKKRFEVGVSIERPLGQFHRTAKVLVAPRFVFVNQTQVTFKISQSCRENDSNVVEVEPCYKYFFDSATNTMDPVLAAGSTLSPSMASASQSARERAGYEETEHVSGGPLVWTPFDFLYSDSIAQTRKRRVFIKMAHATAQWSGPFAIDYEKEFPLRLRGGVASSWSSTRSWTRPNKDKDDPLAKFELALGAFAQYRLRIRITAVGATMVITLMKDDPPMFFIRNESTLELHVSQARASESSMMLQSGEYVPFAWDRPEKTTRVSCRVSSPKTRAFGIEWNRTSVKVPRLFDFENLDREKGIVELTRWFYGRSISGEIKVEKSSRVLVFKDQVAKKEPEYLMEIKILSTKMRTREGPDTLGRFCVQIMQEKRFTEYKERKNSNLYRFDSELAFSFRSRPKHLKLTLCETSKVNAQLDQLNDQRDVSSISIHDKEDPIRASKHQDISAGNMVDLTRFEDDDHRFGLYRSIQTPDQWCRQISNIPNCDSDRPNDLEDDLIQSQSSSSSEEVDNASRLLHTNVLGSACKLGRLKIRIPAKIWAQNHNDQRHFDSIASIGPNCLSHAAALSYTCGYDAGQPALNGAFYGAAVSNESNWWALQDSESGDIIGEVQLALKCRRTFVPAASMASDFFNISVTIPSIGISFLHNSTPNQSMLEVAFLSLQRMSLLYSCVNGQNSEVVFRLGNLQMDNQMDAEVVVGPKIQKVDRGVSIRLRDRLKACLDYRYRGILSNDIGLLQNSTSFKTPNNVVHFRMLWNAQCVAGDITHYELIQLAIQELEMSTDEKFIVNLIIVFQGLEILTRQHSFDEIVDSEISFVDEKAALAAAYVANLASRGLVNTMLEYENQKDAMRRRQRDADTEAAAITKLASLNPTNQSIYVEELQIDGIRIQFSVELNGGRYIRTLGSVGRRLATYFPESNVKDLGLNLPKATFSHIYNSQATIIRSLLYHYRHHAVLVVVRGLHTVSLYANPLRICYRFLHGIIELIRLPLRGLMSGSPIELLNGAYLGVRALVMNLISGGYEIVAGAAGLLTIFVGLILPESKRRAFEEDMFAFQRSVMEEVDAFDAQEERAMVKTIVRQPRKFDAGNIGLLTVYGPGALPIEEQSQIDYNAAVMIQEWWRRRRLAEKLMEHVRELNPNFETITEEKTIKTSHWKECLIL
ncbi:unnamed protein product [Albugo candida]|nr:unnamed protein product [Albugo candida]|eukprot:CCI50166.1 unnamed protein product [Albugo candida]